MDDNAAVKAVQHGTGGRMRCAGGAKSRSGEEQVCREEEKQECGKARPEEKMFWQGWPRNNRSNSSQRHGHLSFHEG
jgi:hypothetical protein